MLNRLSLREKTNANTSRPSSRGGTKTKAKTKAKATVPAPAVTIEEATSLELATLSAVLQLCRSDTKTSLTKLARLAKSSGTSELASDIKAFAEQYKGL